MTTATIEITDTFGGEANYSWVERKTFDIDGLTDRQIELKATVTLNNDGKVYLRYLDSRPINP